MGLPTRLDCRVARVEREGTGTTEDDECGGLVLAGSTLDFYQMVGRDREILKNTGLGRRTDCSFQLRADMLNGRAAARCTEIFGAVSLKSVFVRYEAREV